MSPFAPMNYLYLRRIERNPYVSIQIYLRPCRIAPIWMVQADHAVIPVALPRSAEKAQTEKLRLSSALDGREKRSRD
jgi:hypothetical protein